MENLKRSVARGIGRLSNKLCRRIHSFSLRGSYSGAEGRTLHFILANSDIELFQKDIEEEYGIRPPTASRLLQGMEEKGLIVRRPVGYDARLKRIIATPKALQYRSQVMEELDELEAELTQGVAPQELEVFYRVLEQMIKNMA